MLKRFPALFSLFISPFVLPNGASAAGGAYDALVSQAPGFEAAVPDVPAADETVHFITAPKPLADPAMEGSKWPSMFGSVHKQIMKNALEMLKTDEFEVRNDSLMSGASSESGHPSMSDNGGNPADIWFSRTRHYDGGVMKNYEQFNSSTAYRNIGVICHLTQDMAVPTHAANIAHGLLVHKDTFEAYGGNDARIVVPDTADGVLPPYAYYQVLQDETRAKLPGWVDPATNLPYWVVPDNAVRFGEDVTKGPQGRYGGKAGADAYANDEDVSASPGIHEQQLAAAALASVNVLKAASRSLPPLIYNLTMDSKVKAGKTAPLSFGIVDNAPGKVRLTVLIYRDGALVGEMMAGTVALLHPNSSDMPYFSRQIRTQWTGVVDFKVLPAGKYVLEVQLTDEDGNTVPEEVNQDKVSENDTRITVTVK